MNNGKAPACVPTWRGHIETTKDALIIFEACFTGALAHCFRRPHDRERNQLIVSGNVFVYEEATSGIKRWTDGIPWSPSRILTNFLIYRQLNNPFPPGEKKRATKRGQRPTRPGDPYPTSGSKGGTSEDSYQFSPRSPVTPGLKSDEGVDKDANRGLLGSLVDSYEFKENGLLKKTMTVVINNVQHHLVSYYSLDDAKYNLETPRDDPRLKDIPLRDELLNQPKFKFPNFDDAGDGAFEQMDGTQNQYAYYPQTYDPARHLSVAAHGHSSQQEPLGQVYYPGISQYVSQPHTSHNHVTYASIPPTPSAYIPISAANIPYSQQHHQHHQHHQVQNQNQQPVQHSTNQAHHQLLPPTQMQSLQNTHQAAHQIQSSYSQSSPYSAQNHNQQRPTHQLSYSEHQVQPVTYQQQPASTTLPRPANVFEFLSASQDSYNPTHEFYSSNPASVAPLNDSALLLPQPWHAPFTQPYGSRPDASSYPSYRAQS